MYDSIGNRVAQGLNGTATGGHWQITTYNHNSLNNELTSSNSNAVTTQYGYDSNGNLLTKNIGPTTHWNYTWNVQGQLLKVANDSGVQGYYAYDGFGRRVESKESNTPIFYYYLGTETLGETGVFPDNDYVYANGLRIAMVNDAAGYHPTVVYYHTDALGSTRLVTSANKSVLFSDSYQPFGQDNNVSGSATYKFTGKPVSQTTGLYYDYQRWYDPSLGRFISRDPDPGNIGDPSSLNGYSYCFNDPTGFVDSNGANPVYAFYNAIEGFLASQLVLHGSSSLGIYVLGPNGPLKARWGPGSIFSDRPLYMHTTFVLEDLRASGKASQYWKYDLESAGGRVGRWNPLKGAMDHPPEFDPWLGRAVATEGYLARIGWVVGLEFSAYDILSAVSTDYSSGDGLTHTIPTVTHEAFGWGGAIAGAEAFGEAGAGIGSLFGPAGIAIGGLVGGLIGGILGFTYGSQVGDWIGERIINAGSASWGFDSGTVPFRNKIQGI